MEAYGLRVFWYIEAIYAQIFRTVISKSVLVRKDIRRSRPLELVSKALLLEGSVRVEEVVHSRQTVNLLRAVLVEACLRAKLAPAFKVLLRLQVLRLG